MPLFWLHSGFGVQIYDSQRQDVGQDRKILFKTIRPSRSLLQSSDTSHVLGQGAIIDSTTSQALYVQIRPRAFTLAALAC